MSAEAGTTTETAKKIDLVSLAMFPDFRPAVGTNLLHRESGAKVQMQQYGRGDLVIVSDAATGGRIGFPTHELFIARHLIPPSLPGHKASPAPAPFQLSTPLPSPAPRLPPPSLPAAQSPARPPATQPRPEPRRAPGAEQGRVPYQQQKSDAVRQARDLAAAMAVEREKSIRATGRDLHPSEAVALAKRALGLS